MTDEEIKKLALDCSLDIIDVKKLNAMTEAEREKFRQYYNGYLALMHRARPM